MLSKEQIQHIAALARIELAAEEIEKFQQQLGAILDFVEKLNRADTRSIEPILQVAGIANTFREDIGGGSNVRPAASSMLLGQAPRMEGSYVKVKAIFE